MVSQADDSDAMRCNAILPCQLPPLLSLCLFFLPLDAMTVPAQYMSSSDLACSSRIARMRSFKRLDCRLRALRALAADFSRLARYARLGRQRA